MQVKIYIANQPSTPQSLEPKSKCWEEPSPKTEETDLSIPLTAWSLHLTACPTPCSCFGPVQRQGDWVCMWERQKDYTQGHTCAGTKPKSSSQIINNISKIELISVLTQTNYFWSDVTTQNTLCHFPEGNKAPKLPEINNENEYKLKHDNRSPVTNSILSQHKYPSLKVSVWNRASSYSLSLSFQRGLLPRFFTEQMKEAFFSLCFNEGCSELPLNLVDLIFNRNFKLVI